MGRPQNLKKSSIYFYVMSKLRRNFYSLFKILELQLLQKFLLKGDNSHSVIFSQIFVKKICIWMESEELKIKGTLEPSYDTDRLPFFFEWQNFFSSPLHLWSHKIIQCYILLSFSSSPFIMGPKSL